MKRILFLFIIFLVSCRSLDSVQEFRGSAVQQFRSIDTVVLRDSMYRHDSVIYRERTIHDTVYITKEVYRNASHSTLNAQHSTHSDTVIVTEWRDRIIEKPPERYIPRFYRWCTIAFWIILLSFIGYALLRGYLRR